MHGDISLKSELGQGTITTFWVPFVKPQSSKISSPLKGAKPVAERLRSDVTIPGCHSAQQSVNEDLQNVAPPGHTNSRTGRGLELVPPELEPVPTEQGPNEPSAEQELDRKKVHVLVVEDKSVTSPSRVCSFVSAEQVTDSAMAVLLTSRLLSRQSKRSGSL